MDDLQTSAARPLEFETSEAEKIMTAAGWRRTTSAGALGFWRKDHQGGEYSLITADGDCDADPLAIVWTAGRYRHEGEGFVGDVAMDPHHTSLARALERVATLSITEPPRPSPTDEFFRDAPDAED